MGLDEAKADSALIYIDALDKKLDAVLANIEGERAEGGRRFELHSQSIVNSATATIERKFAELTEAIKERIDDKIKACLSDQDRDLGAAIVDIGNLKQDVAELDVRTREVPLLRGRIEHLETKPGQNAIKAWQWMAAGGVSAAGVAFGIVSWILSN
jgi:hypothetical protein